MDTEEPVAVRCGCGRRGGFTLIELLMVIAIIGVLIAILLPALGKAKILAKASQCLSNQRSIGQAMNMYATQYKDFVPREGTDYPTAPPQFRRDRIPWPVAFRPFLDTMATVDPEQNDRYVDAAYYHDPARPPDTHNVHYVVNGIPFRAPGVADLRGVTDERFRRGPTYLGILVFPASTIYITDFTDDERHVISNAMATTDQSDMAIGQFYDLFHPFNVELHGSNDTFLADRIAPWRHGMGANATFLDGHARYHDARFLRDVANWDDGDYRPIVPPRRRF